MKLIKILIQCKIKNARLILCYTFIPKNVKQDSRVYEHNKSFGEQVNLKARW